MLRIVIAVAADETGWWVNVLDSSDETPLVDPYRMDAAEVDGRPVPVTPAERRPDQSESHASLCAGDEEISALLNRIRTRMIKPDDVTRYGRWLFECLLAPAWPAIRLLPQAATGVELALRWPVSDTGLHRMVWEAMHDGTAPLAGHPEVLVGITRLVVTPAAPERRPIDSVPRVLFAAGTSITDATIRPGAMYMGLLRAFDAGGMCRSRVLQSASVDDLRAACQQFSPDVVHLVAHGVLLDGGRGALMMRAEPDGEQEVDATTLVSAITAGGRPTAVVLSACNTSAPGFETDPGDAAPLAAQLVAAGIPMVTAMSGEVSEPACRQYTRRFAQSVHAGRSPVVASAHGRRAAMVSAAQATSDIDWALPALFLNEQLDPSRPLVDPGPAARLIALAGELKLSREPVFIGRGDVLTAADRLVEQAPGPAPGPAPGQAGRLGVVAALCSGATSGLGGTRLLQEVGWRLLRAGHVPVLLGPYQSASSAPTTAHALVVNILTQVVRITQAMKLPPFEPQTLPPDPASPPGDEQNPVRFRAAIRKRITAFGKLEDDELDPDTVRDLLAEDLTELADRAQAWGPPFGPHSRPVLLGDDVHGWASASPDPDVGPQGALEFLLRMVSGGASGIGDLDRPVPVLMTGSRTLPGGAALLEWAKNPTPGTRVLELKELDAAEAVLGFQWVLLHPWTTRPAEEQELFGRVYTCGPEKAEAWERGLQTLNRLPAVVQGDLYVLVKGAAAMGGIRRDDDEQAWNDYADLYPEARR